jgi:nuclear protein localization protein 4 homolog
MSKTFVIRIRGPTGMWRVNNLNSKSTIKTVMEDIQKTKGIPLKDQSIYLDQGNTKQVQSRDSLTSKLKLKHGDILYIKFKTEQATKSVLAQAAPIQRKSIAEDGSIISKTTTTGETNAVRPGLMSLRSRKLHWTMDELMQLEANYTFKIQRQKKAVCDGVSLDNSMCQDFVSFCTQLQYKQYRGAWLYGKFVKMLKDSKLKAEEEKPAYDSRGRKLKVKAKRIKEGENEDLQVRVDCLYEPPQNCTNKTLELLEDPNEEHVEAMARALGLERVGFVFAHPSNRNLKDVRFHSNEIMLCAENQLLAGDEKMESPFVTVKCFRNEENNVEFEAFQMSKQCLEMVAEEVLQADMSKPSMCGVSDTFSVLVEAKEVGYVDNDYFLCRVPIMQHHSFLKVGLPQANRPTGHNWQRQPAQILQSFLARKKSLSTVERFSDFQVLILLGKVLDRPTFLAVLQSIIDKEVPLEDGNKMILDSLSSL